MGTRASRADLEQTAHVHLRERAAAGADRADVDPRRLDRHSLDRPLEHQLCAAARDEAGVEARSADVGGDDVAELEAACELAGAFRACDRADMIVSKGRSSASANVIAPPPERVTIAVPSKPAPRSRVSSARR